MTPSRHRPRSCLIRRQTPAARFGCQPSLTLPRCVPSPRESRPRTTFPHTKQVRDARNGCASRGSLSAVEPAVQSREDVMRTQHVIIGVVSLVLAGCARLVSPDSIVALEVGPHRVNVLVGATTPLRVVGTRGDGRTVTLSGQDVRFFTSDSSVARVTSD